MFETKARETLTKKLEDHGAQTRIAGLLRIRQSTVSHWVAGTSRPETHLRVALDLLLGIPLADWLTAEETKLLAHVRAELKRSKTKASAA